MKGDPHERLRPLGRTLALLPVAPIALLAPGLILWPLAGTSQTVGPDPLSGSTYDLAALLASLVVVIAVNALFVAGQTSIERLKSQHSRTTEAETRSERVVRDLVNRRDDFLAACFLGSQTMRAWLVVLSFVPAPTAAQSWGEYGWPAGWLGVLLAGALLAVPVAAVNVMFGELVPKAYAAAHSVRTAVRLYQLIRVFASLLWLPGKAATWMAGLVTQRFGAPASFAVSPMEEEIRHLLESAEETGEIEEEEKEMLHSVFEFGDTVAREVMTPRVDLDALPVSAGLDDVVQVVEESGHSRIPVYEGTDDQIVGIVHAKDVLRAIARGESTSLVSLMRPALFVPENKLLHDLLKEMRLHRTQLVVVQDEFGGTAGVVSIEDIVEEVVGEIVDEYDAEEPEIVESEGGYLVGGKANLDDLNDEIGSNFHSDEFDTVGGYLFGLFGRQPQQGEQIEAAGWRFTVTETDGRRIIGLFLAKLTAADELELVQDSAVNGGRSPG